MVEVLHSAFLDDIHAELHKLFNVAAERSRVGGDAVFLQMGGYVRKGDRVHFVRGLPEVFEYEECSICERHSPTPFLFFLLRDGEHGQLRDRTLSL